MTIRVTIFSGFLTLQLIKQPLNTVIGECLAPNSGRTRAHRHQQAATGCFKIGSTGLCPHRSHLSQGQHPGLHWNWSFLSNSLSLSLSLGRSQSAATISCGQGTIGQLTRHIRHSVLLCNCRRFPREGGVVAVRVAGVSFSWLAGDCRWSVAPYVRVARAAVDARAHARPEVTEAQQDQVDPRKTKSVTPDQDISWCHRKCAQNGQKYMLRPFCDRSGVDDGALFALGSHAVRFARVPEPVLPSYGTQVFRVERNEKKHLLTSQQTCHSTCTLHRRAHVVSRNRSRPSPVRCAGTN